MFMPCMRRCFFHFALKILHDVSAHTVFVAVISQMKDFSECSLGSFDEDEWRPGSRLCNLQPNALR